MVKNPPASKRPGFNPWVGKIPWRREQLPTPVFWPGEFHDCTFHGVARRWTRMSNFHFQSIRNSHAKYEYAIPVYGESRKLRRIAPSLPSPPTYTSVIILFKYRNQTTRYTSSEVESGKSKRFRVRNVSLFTV